jgi:HEAT repeat protein
MGPDAVPALPPLAEGLKDSAREVRRVALESLLNVDSGAVRDALIKALVAQDKYARTELAFALGQIGSEARSALPAFLGLLQDSSWLVRRAALVALRQIGPDPDKAVPILLKLLADDYDLVRESRLRSWESLAARAEPPFPRCRSSSGSRRGSQSGRP